MRCEICKEKIQSTFLKKIVGTYVKDKKGKQHTICSSCQNKFKNKEEILKQL